VKSLNIPIIKVEGILLSKRVTLIANNGIIEKVFYPVFPPNENINEVMSYLNANTA
jgi:peroxiredoxin